MIRQLAWSSLRRHTTRTILAILGVAVAAAMLLDMVMMSTGLRESFRELLLSRGFELRLAPKGTLPFDTDATIDNVSGITAKLRSNSEITTISPVLGGTIHVPVNGRVITSAVLGVNPSVQGDYEMVSGHNSIAPDAIVVNETFLRATGKKIGDTIDVATGYNPQLRTYSGTRNLVITGRARFIYGAANQLANIRHHVGRLHAERVEQAKIATLVDDERLRRMRHRVSARRPGLLARRAHVESVLDAGERR